MKALEVLHILYPVRVYDLCVNCYVASCIVNSLPFFMVGDVTPLIFLLFFTPCVRHLQILTGGHEAGTTLVLGANKKGGRRMYVGVQVNYSRCGDTACRPRLSEVCAYGIDASPCPPSRLFSSFPDFFPRPLRLSVSTQLTQKQRKILVLCCF